ncbi:MAG: hypothetical protein NT169_02185 [Chloroflexi bacterium]|nr:hypothetical protein [Chloroflexota bacterium]
MTRAALLAAKHGVKATISGDYGPNCYGVLEGAGIPMYLCGAAKTARAAVKLFRAGQLVSVNAPISSGSHGELEDAPAR